MSYFRFNANTGSEEIDLADWRKMEELKQDTVKYLEQEDVKGETSRVAEMLARR